MSEVNCKVLVVGGGPAGLAAATMLAQAGVDIICLTTERPLDGRTVALMMPAIRMLRSISAWDENMALASCALKHLHIKDDTGNLVTAPDLNFSASEINQSVFGYNIPLDVLVPSLQARAVQLGVLFINEKATSVAFDENSIAVSTAGGLRIRAELAIAADGVNSILRKATGVDVQSWAFDQTALITRFNHSATHHETSTEWHRKGGLFTTVPMPGQRSSLVWMGRPGEIEQLSRLDANALATEIQLASHGTLGLVSGVETTQTFAMRGQIVRRFSAHRVMLIGEAAHVFPPVGAQGLNLSLRDAGHAVDCATTHDDAGADQALVEYDRKRQGDVAARAYAISLVNHSLLAEAEGLHLLRAAGLAAVAAFPPLRGLVMREGLAPESNLPFAMR